MNAEQTRATAELIMGPQPGTEKQCPLDVEVVEDVDLGSYRRQLLHYRSEPDQVPVPAYLCVPADASAERPAPAALCLHGTNDVVGHGTVVGLGNGNWRGYASELAQRGWVTLAPGYPLLANHQPDILGRGWQSGTAKAIWDNRRGLDLLASLDVVRPGPVAAIGHSLGGHNSVFTAVFDERIGAVVSSCGLDSFVDYMGGDEAVWRPGEGWTQLRYMPKLADYRGRLDEIPFDFDDLLGALAPRPVLVIAPTHDHNFVADSVDRVVGSARSAYRDAGAPDALQVWHPDAAHDFPPDVRTKAYDWLADQLGGN
ncbi:alpha/beta hydrolase family protein [Microlunatus sp. Y2014]|uniref:alpha/beta hydrolase family protein n=1 Tax=Microlunatus sp. Y2014 TaxID=3418488 RepID=UPI003DA74D84